MMTPAGLLIRAENVRKRFGGSWILRGVSVLGLVGRPQMIRRDGGDDQSIVGRGLKEPAPP